MSPDLATSAKELLASLASPEDTRAEARRLEVVRRQGVVDAYSLLATVVLGLVVRGKTTIAAVGRLYGRVTRRPIARSAFWNRLTPEFALLVKWLLDRMVAQAAQTLVRPPGVLSCFQSVFAADSTVVKVHDDLRPIWKGTRTNSAKAALKVHTRIEVFSGRLLHYEVTPEAYGDSRGFAVCDELAGALTLFDMGYASPSLWRRIGLSNGYFLTRIPSGWNQEIVEEHRRHRGRARRLIGLGLGEAFHGLRRRVIDVGARFKCRVFDEHGEKVGTTWETYRVVGVLNEETQEHHLYVTNVPLTMLAAEHIPQVYRLRWEVETFYKTAKSGCGLDEQTSTKRHIVETMVYAALIRAALSMRAKWHLLGFAPLATRVAINPGLWTKWWNSQLPSLLDWLLWRPERGSSAALIAALTDPNRKRRTTRATFVAGLIPAY